MGDADFESFRPNGLLGVRTKTPSVDASASDIQDDVDSFTPNGLLGKLAFTPQKLISGDLPATLEPGAVSPMRPNGLLAMPRVGPLASDVSLSPLRPNGILRVLKNNTTEDTLPDIADILRSYPRNDAASHAPLGNPGLLPRFSVRSTTFEGKALYLRKKTRNQTRPSVGFDISLMRYALSRATSKEQGTSGQRMAKLLDVPIHRLMDELSVKTASKLAQGDQAQASGPDVSDLLGDERLHREVLGWVKEWDYCVFGKRKAKKRTRDAGQSDLPEDQYQRPREKILLLSGPPGLGKTTLAHIVAKQAGYNVFEINASDARSGQIVDDRIRPALESGFSIGSTRPNLVVIDEIDGATGAGDNATSFIQKLTQLALEKPFKERRGKKKDPKGKRPLLRPIICICNDLYASSLAKLRPLSHIIRFTRPADIHIVKRLRDICEMEGLKADSRALSTLVGAALGDLRGCLNTLQFIKSRSQDVTEQMIRAATVGMKEGDSSFSGALNSLFLPMSKRRVKELGLNEEDENKYVDRIARELEGSGTLDRIALGCFEHYANVHQHDATFARYMKANEWLVSYDVLSGSMRSEREYSVLPYLAYAIVPFHPLFQERGGARVERPKADWENHLKTRANEEIYKSLARSTRTGSGRVTGHHRHLVSNDILHLEFAPYLNRIISPPLRPVNSQVIRPEEKAVLARLVGIMVSLELRFVQEKAEDGQLIYRLDPPIDVFVTYDGKRAADIAASRYAVRHLVAAEIDAQLIARQADFIERSKAQASKNFFGGNANADAEDADQKDRNGTSGTLSLRGAVPAEEDAGRPRKRAKAEGAVDIADRPAVDFFGRPIVVPRKPASARGRADEQEQAPSPAFRIAYKHKEGNSAAVRKPVKVSSFL
ncbi:hypothetical protein EW146_g3644 [Bondarzewia mesenterica]|uniref:AAA+ ATPase domain-containing protein n=1 Tax=Bondarzewia mesenterica TaxID=1095465 RepID=A0A4V3XFE0_9AGAM|nr:hypothetical protein EW146_g3644 [Bondarzewia mesenterica]